jgi:hypothetical protein
VTVWEPLLQALIGVAAAAVPIIAAQTWRYLGERIQASAVGRLGEGAKRAAGTVAAELAASPAGALAIEAVKDAAIERATATLSATMAGTLDRLGGSRPELATMVRGELGRLLAPAQIAAAQAKPAIGTGLAQALAPIGGDRPA